MKIELGLAPHGLGRVEAVSWNATLIVGGRGAAGWLRERSDGAPTGGSTKRGLAPIDEAAFRRIRLALMSLPDLWDGLLVEDADYRRIACIDGDAEVGCSRYDLPAGFLDPSSPASPEPAFLEIWRPCFALVEPALVATGMPRELLARFR